MRDPREGVSPHGTIVTGVDRGRVPAAYQDVVTAAAELVHAHGARGSLYLYGSVATGQARTPSSDVDLFTVDVDPEASAAIGRTLSVHFADRCRGVEMSAARAADYLGDTDASYGNRVFLHHYCVHIAGPPQDASQHDYPADVRAARGFNGDIAICAERWRRALDHGARPGRLARPLARKTLLAVAGLVSIHDRTWTTDRATSARRWAEVDPELGPDLGELVSWMDGQVEPDHPELARVLGGPMDQLIRTHASVIGLWR